MQKNHFVYKDKEVKRFNHVTVVKGNSTIKENFTDQLDSLLTKMESLVWNLTFNKETIGKSKCSPEDKYDKKTGLIVASRKAELRGAKHYLQIATELRRETELLLELAKDFEDKLDYKTGKLSLDLVRLSRGKE